MTSVTMTQNECTFIITVLFHVCGKAYKHVNMYKLLQHMYRLCITIYIGRKRVEWKGILQWRKLFIILLLHHTPHLVLLGQFPAL